jgi:hypothetical protein
LYRARLWAAIMEYERDRERGIEHARALFAETDPLPWVPLGCSFAWQSCDLKEALARLDPRLLFALPTPYRDSALAGYGSIASSRWREGYRDGLTGAYALHALGAGSAENLWPHAVYYDTSAALKSALQLPAVPHDAKSPRASALAVLLAGKAWTDPEGALALAEAETPGAAREHVISSVAGVWASARPERIGRAMRELTDAHLRDEHGRTAKEELARRAEGLPPRDSLLKVQQARVLRYQRKPYPQPPTRASAHPDVIRVLANPANTAWLTGPTRDVRLREAAEVAYHDRDNSETFDAVLALLPAPPQPEGWDPQSVFSNWFCHGRKVDAFTLLRDTKSPGLYCAHALDLVRSLSRREDW